MSSGESDHARLLAEALLAIQTLKSKLARLQLANREPIAVIGIGCRFPGDVSSPDDFWTLLENGLDGIVEIPPDRWDIDSYYDPDPDARGKVCTRFGGVVNRKGGLDPRVFQITPREALYMDPPQPVLLGGGGGGSQDPGSPPAPT